MEISVFDPELQRLIDELDHLNNSIPVDSLLGGAQQQDAKFDPFMSAMDDESYLSLYDLCGGNPILVDTIKWANSGPSIGSSTTPLVAAAPSLQNDDFDFPAPRVGGKWVPKLHSSLVPISWYYASTPLAMAAQLTVPTPRPATPDPAPVSSRGGPSRPVRNATNTRHQPYRKAALAKRDASGSTKGKRMRRAGRTETRDYLCAHPAKAEDITRLQGCRGLIREGRWGPIIVDTLRQIGVPYPTKGLQRVLAELYDGEGDQEGIPKEVKDRPAYPWRVSLKAFSVFSRTVSDDIFFFHRVRSPGICVSRRKGIVPFQTGHHL